MSGQATGPLERKRSPPIEKRSISVLFADIVGFTTFSEHSDPEDVREMLTAYYERSRGTIERLGGSVEKFIGDAVMGVWGMTLVREDDAERAVRAGLELVDLVHSLRDEFDNQDLELRVGVNSGFTVVGPGGNEIGLVVGDLVNTAARLQTAANPGTVVVGSATRAAAGQSFSYESLGDLTVKGRNQPASAWFARRSSGSISSPTEEWLRRPPFVGRDRELRLLKNELASVQAERQARLVSIVGEAGIGKTRLAEEFKRSVDSLGADACWHQGRSPSYGEGVALWALGEMVRRRAGIAERDDPDAARTRLRVTVAEFFDGSERLWVLPHLERLLGMNSEPHGRRNELFAAIRKFFQKIAERATTVLVFEDFHWADSSLVEFVTELVEHSLQSQMLIVTLARPDLRERFPSWDSRVPRATHLELSPLTDIAMTELLSGHLPGASEDTIDRIVNRSTGVPLFAVELARTLSASGILEEASGKYRFLEDAGPVELPESLRAVIEARLDRLDPEARLVLTDGSVLGQAFTGEALRAVRGGNTGDQNGALQRLIRLGLIELDEDPQSPERGQYVFAQSLFREVAYQRLGREDRRTKHIAAADHFSSLDDPELADVVASHVARAYEATPRGPAREALATRAIQSLRDAASRAGSLGSHARALSLLDLAIVLTDNPDEKADLLLLASGHAAARLEVDQGIEYIQEARAHFAAAGNADGLLRSATAHSSILNSHHRSDEALVVIRPVYASISEATDVTSVGVMAEAARSLVLNDFDDETIDVVSRLLPAAEELGLDEIVLQSRITLATAFTGVGRTAEAEQVIRNCAAAAEDSGLLRVAGRAYNNLGAVTHLDNPRAASSYAERLYEIAAQLGELEWMLGATVDLAVLATAQGEYEDARRTLDGVDSDLLTDYWAANFAIVRAYCELLETGSESAATDCLAALSYFDDETDPQTRASADKSKCDVYALLGDWDRVYETALTIKAPTTARGLQMAARAAAWTRSLERIRHVSILMRDIRSAGRFIDGQRLFIEATQFALEGDSEQASAAFEDIVQLFDAIAMDLDRMMVRTTFAMLVGQEDAGAALAAREAAAWLAETGSKGLASAWADGLPAVLEMAEPWTADPPGGC